MKKILLNIFFILIISPYSKSINCEEITEKTKCISEVMKYTDLCYYFESLDGIDHFCKTVPYSSYYKGYKKEYRDYKLFNVTCPNEESMEKTFPLEKCGDIHDKENTKFKDCKKYSSLVNSCCYFSNEEDDIIDKSEFAEKFEKGCYWLGSKYEGKIEWAGIKLQCKQNYLNYSIFNFFIFMGILLF